MCLLDSGEAIKSGFKSFLILKSKTTTQRQHTCRQGFGPAGAGVSPAVILSRRGAGAAGGKERTAGHQVGIHDRRGGRRSGAGGLLQERCGREKEDQRHAVAHIKATKGDNSASGKNLVIDEKVSDSALALPSPCSLSCNDSICAACFRLAVFSCWFSCSICNSDKPNALTRPAMDQRRL